MARPRHDTDGDQPHREILRVAAASERAFELSADPHFIRKVRGISVLSLALRDPASGALLHGKPQIQAPAPAAPVLPGEGERKTDDYVRPVTPDHFAAPDAAELDAVIAECRPGHRRVEFRHSPDGGSRNGPPEPEVHPCLDKLAIRKTTLTRDCRPNARATTPPHPGSTSSKYGSRS
jgi:hypothetical protein